MEEASIAIVGVICCIALPILLGMMASYMIIKSRHTERMAMIEKGVSLQEAGQRDKMPNRYPALRNGMFMVGIALGIFAGIFISPSMPDESNWADFTVPMMAILFGGIAFIIYFFVSRKLLLKEKEQDNLPLHE